MRRIVKALIPQRLFKAIEPYGHLLESVLWQVVYGFPASDLKVIGVTGTDGKTTTTSFIWQMLKNSGYKVGYMSTVGYGTHLGQHQSFVHMTTMQTRQLLKRIKELKADGIEWLVLETSSHALAQNRVWGIPYQIAVMTNVTGDHLDYHGTFERYRDAKRKLFTMVGANSRGMQEGVVNADDPASALFAREVTHPLSYGLKYGDIKAEDATTTATGSRYIVRRGSSALNMIVNIPGDFNVYNSLAAVCVGLTLELTDDEIEQGVAALKNVEGRMTRIDEGQKFDVIVDFASTPAGFEAVLPGAKQSAKGRLIVVFGSAGRRDPAKRAAQGEIAGKYADVVIATEEDDREEDGQKILEAIAGGAEKSGKKRDKNLFLILNRPKAIAEAMKLAKPGDTVMLLGKGHEKTIERADGEHPWDEIGEAKKALHLQK
ncbi:MAG TPA: UDP-N-acetylmuramyl-tripeptide synthetase [Candidatus Saccharimonadales bacterium]|nr:UDP-N-acetylmuramyl-tripeptide synthetase [Candidatus Saccharimonadales bacterium]